LAVGIAAMGEGWHNYHHVFPWDYKAAELGGYETNWTTCFLDFFVRLGWAYDMKTVSDEMILKRIQRTGDGTHSSQQTKDSNGSVKFTTAAFRKMLNDEHHEGEMVWGWDDKDMKNEDKVDAKIIGAKLCD
jgi:stearoyl-CoA desaturase (Delta-9 desaturase)